MPDLITRLRATLPAAPPIGGQASHHRQAAVALILRHGSHGAELFLIERAPHDNDPWSGNIAFPGGKVEHTDATPRLAAERETREEIGIDLQHADYLGFLTEIIGAHLPIRVACFVYLLTEPPALTLNREIADAFWVPLAMLTAAEQQILAPVAFAGEIHQVEAILLPQPGKPVLWGITYRLLQQFFTLTPEESCVT